MSGPVGTMHALVLHGLGDARFESIPLPEPGLGEVRGPH